MSTITKPQIDGIHLLSLSLDHEIHSDEIRVIDLILIGRLGPKCLQGKMPDEIIGRHEKGSTYTARFTTPTAVDLHQVIKAEDREYVVTKVDSASRGRTRVYSVTAVAESSEPSGYVFYDEDVAKWFEGKSQS